MFLMNPKASLPDIFHILCFTYLLQNKLEYQPGVVQRDISALDI